MKQIEREIEKELGGIREDMIQDLRKHLQIGEVVIYRKVSKVEDDPRLLVTTEIKVRVKAKYRHLIEVEEIGGRPYPVKTMTYVEILQERRKKEENCRRKKHV